MTTRAQTRNQWVRWGQIIIALAAALCLLAVFAHWWIFAIFNALIAIAAFACVKALKGIPGDQ